MDKDNMSNCLVDKNHVKFVSFNMACLLFKKHFVVDYLHQCQVALRRKDLWSHYVFSYIISQQAIEMSFGDNWQKPLQQSVVIAQHGEVDRIFLLVGPAFLYAKNASSYCENIGALWVNVRMLVLLTYRTYTAWRENAMFLLNLNSHCFSL